MTIPDSLIIEVLNPIKLPLIKKLYKAYYPAGRAKKDELIITASHKGEIIALLRLKSVDKVRLLTGMLVIPKVRGTGIGKELLNHCKNNVFTDGDYASRLHISNPIIPSMDSQQLIALSYHTR